MDGRQGREYIELGTGSGVRIAGLNTLTNTQSYVQTFNGLFTNLNVSGISTLGSVGVDTLTVSELTVDEITATDAVVGTATITSAEIGDASVGFITATDIVATAVTSYKGNFDILEFGEGPSGGGTGIDSTSIQTENLLISGIATINSGIFTSIQSENINVSGTTTSVSIDATTIDTTNLTAEVGAITNLVNGNLVSTGIATLNEVVAGILTVGELDANVIQIDNVDADNAVIGLATITEELVGISTIGFADITDARIGAATITNLTATTIDIDGIDGEVGRLIDLEVTGIATIADLEAGNTRLGITTVTGFLDVVGYTTVSGDLTIGGNLQVEGDLSYDEVNGRNANITGIGTVNDLNWTTAVGGALTVTGTSDLAHVDAESLSVSGLSTFVGVATFQDDIYVGGNLYVEGDLAYDEVNGRNANITGVGTVNHLNWTTAVGGALTVTDNATFEEDVYVDRQLVVDQGINSGGIITTKAFQTEDENEVSTIAGELSVSKLTTVTDIVGSSGTFTDFTVANLTAGGIEIDGAELDNAEIVNLSVSGIATIAQVEINSGIATLSRLEATDTVGTAATFTNLEVTNINAIGGGTLSIDSITANTGIFTALAVEQLGVSTISVTGFSTFAGDMFVAGVATITTLKVGEIETLGGGGLSVDSIQTGDLNVTGLSTFVGFTTFNDMFVGGAATITNLEVGEITSLGGGSLDVDAIKVTDLEVTGVSTFVGVATFQDDIYIGGNLNIQGDLSYDEVNGRNANITGVGTVNHLNWTTAVGGALTVTGHSDLDSINVGGISTFVGVATFQDDLYVGGNIFIEGDLSYDEVNGRNANITGVGTVNRLYVTTDADVGRNFNAAGISTLNEVNANTLAVGFVTATDAFVGVLTASLIDFSGQGGIGTDDGSTGISSQFIITPNLVVTGITTLNHLNVETVNAGVVTAISFVGMGSELTHLPPASFISTEAPTVRPDGSALQPGDIWFDSDEFRQFTRSAGVGTGADFWVDSNPTITLPDLQVSNGITTGGVDIALGILEIQGAARKTVVDVVQTGPSTAPSSVFTVGLATDVQLTNLEVTGVSTFVGVSTFKGDVYIDGNLIIDGDESKDLVSGTNLLISGIATIGTLGVTTDLTVGRNLNVIGIATVGSISAGDISLDDIDASGSVSIGGSLTMQPAPTGDGGVYFDNSVVGMGTALIFDSASVGGDLGVGNSLGVVGDSYFDGNIIGYGGTISGFNDIASPLIRANLTSTLEVATNFISAGDAKVIGVTTTGSLEVGITTGSPTTNYSVVTLSGLSPSSFNQTYQRQSSGFILDTGTVASGNAVFHADSKYSYYVATTGTDPNSRILIWSAVDKAWVAVYDSNGTNFTEGNVTDSQALGLSGIFEDQVTTSIDDPTQDWIAAPSSATSIGGWAASTYGGGKFVAVGTNRVVYSTDGVNWTSGIQTSTDGINWSSEQWRSITYGDGKFVAVAYSNFANNRVMYSTDGINWNSTPAAEANQWYGVTYGDGKFVAVSNTGTNRVMYSTDGINWTSASASENSSWRSVTYGDGKFVAVAANGTNRVMYSSDGINWTSASAAENNDWQSVTYGNGTFVAVAEFSPVSTNAGTNQVMYSTDAINWYPASATFSSSSSTWRSVTFGNGRFVAVSQTGTGTNRVMYSTDGINWTAADASGDNSWYTVTYGDDKFVAFAQFGNTVERVMYSTYSPASSERSVPQAAGSIVYGTSTPIGVAATVYASGDAEFVGVITAAGAVAGTLEVLDDASVGRNLSVGGASTFVGNTKTFGEATFKQDVIIEGNLFTAGGGGGISTDGSTGITSTSISTQDLYVSGIATAQTGDILGDLLVRGNARVVGVVTAENFDSLSDRRYKENIRPIENALDKVSDLNGIHFDYKNSGNKSMGLIAQDVQKVFPECVSGKDPISVNYNGIIGALVEAVKELKDQNEQLRKDIDELKKS